VASPYEGSVTSDDEDWLSDSVDWSELQVSLDFSSESEAEPASDTDTEDDWTTDDSCDEDDNVSPPHDDSRPTPAPEAESSSPRGVLLSTGQLWLIPCTAPDLQLLRAYTRACSPQGRNLQGGTWASLDWAEKYFPQADAWGVISAVSLGLLPLSSNRKY
jgi:hypothetical protein